jgi:microsomal dipeptidase-like Zn-dependent dipeptidase
LSDSHTGEKDNIWLHNGLSELGKKVIAEMNKYGMMVDISHPSKEAIKQMISLSKAPVIASHSSARALCDHSRNLDDELLQLVKKNGGVVQTVAFSGYLNTKKDTMYRNAIKPIYKSIAKEMGIELIDPEDFGKKKDKEIEAFFENLKEIKKRAEKDPTMSQIMNTTPPVDVTDLVDHIDYIVDLIGIDHVGISSDFDGGGGIKGWQDASETFNVTLELVRRGYNEEQIHKLWADNLLRVLDDVQKIAKGIQNKD